MRTGGYPTEQELEMISNWDIRTTDDMVAFAEFVIEIWWMQYGLRWTKRRVKAKYGNDYYLLRLSTGGWSGNEDIIEAMRHNIWWGLCFYSHLRGGHYEFHIPIMK